MKYIIAILALWGLLCGPAHANPAGDRVRVLYVFTPAAKTVIGSASDIRTWITNKTAAASTASAVSGGQTAWQVATNSNGVIQYNDTIATSCCSEMSITPGYSGKNAVDFAAQQLGIAELRDAVDADVVVVVTAAGGETDHVSSKMDCSKTGAEAAKTAFVGVSITGIGATDVEQRVQAALGWAQCAHPANDSYAFMEGVSASSCTMYRTLGSQAATVGPKDIWNVAEGAMAGIAGFSDTGPDAANSDMAGKCVNYVNGVYTYTCTATGTCTTSAPLQCYHTRTQTDTRGSPSCIPGSSGAGGCIVITPNVVSAWAKPNFTCDPNQPGAVAVNLSRYSNPSASYHGMATGTSLKNAVGKMDARFADAKTYYQTKLAPRLKAAAGKATEK